MKKFYAVRFLAMIFFGTLMLLNFTSCTTEPDEEAYAAELIVLTTDKPQYAPFEVVTVTYPEDLSGIQPFTAKINNTEVTINFEGKIASFMLPNLPNGTHDLTFTYDKENFKVPVVVASLPNMLTPDEYFNEVKTSLSNNISELNTQITEMEQASGDPNEYAALRNDVAKYTEIANSAEASYNNLSPADKQDFARVMAASKYFLDRHNSVTESLKNNSISLYKMQNVRDQETQVEISRAAFVANVIFTVAHIPAMVTLVKMVANPNPWFSVGSALAGGLVFASYCVNVDETIIASQRLTSKSLKPFEFLIDGTKQVFNSGEAMVSGIQAKYRSLIGSDAENGSNGGTIFEIVEKFNYFKNSYNSFTSKIPAKFRPGYVMTSLKNTYTSTTNYVHNKYVSIRNISNPNVTVEQLNQSDGSIKIKATTSATDEQSFTYDVFYTNENFTKGLSTTVNAKVGIRTDSTAIYTESAIGLYNVTGPPNVGNGPNSRLTCELKANGEAIYTIYDDPSWANGYYWKVKWSVIKYKNRYYISTSGWLNFYLDYDTQATPLNHPVRTFKHYHNYTKQ